MSDTRTIESCEPTQDPRTGAWDCPRGVGEWDCEECREQSELFEETRSIWGGRYDND